jgi:hypothetical protein
VVKMATTQVEVVNATPTATTVENKV